MVEKIRIVWMVLQRTTWLFLGKLTKEECREPWGIWQIWSRNWKMPLILLSPAPKKTKLYFQLPNITVFQSALTESGKLGEIHGADCQGEEGPNAVLWCVKSFVVNVLLIWIALPCPVATRLQRQMPASRKRTKPPPRSTRTRNSTNNRNGRTDAAILFLTFTAEKKRQVETRNIYIMIICRRLKLRRFRISTEAARTMRLSILGQCQGSGLYVSASNSCLTLLDLAVCSVVECCCHRKIHENSPHKSSQSFYVDDSRWTKRIGVLTGSLCQIPGGLDTGGVGRLVCWAGGERPKMVVKAGTWRCKRSKFEIILFNEIKFLEFHNEREGMWLLSWFRGKRSVPDESNRLPFPQDSRLAWKILRRFYCDFLQFVEKWSNGTFKVKNQPW